jgi:hypothetical protein
MRRSGLSIVAAAFEAGSLFDGDAILMVIGGGRGRE